MSRIVNSTEDKAKIAADNALKSEHEKILKKYEYAGPEWFRENVIKQFNTFSAAKDAVVRSVIVNNMNRIRLELPAGDSIVCFVSAMDDYGFQLTPKEGSARLEQLIEDRGFSYQDVISIGSDGNDTVLCVNF